MPWSGGMISGGCRAFLWHRVCLSGFLGAMGFRVMRCGVAVAGCVGGSGREQIDRKVDMPDILKHAIILNRTPRTPQHMFA